MTRKLPLALAILATGLFAQKPDDAKPADAKTPDKPVPAEKSSVTDHTIQLAGQSISYTATAGTILLKNEKNEPTASLFYVAYTRSGAGDPGTRPLAFIYNGGPGGSSAPQHMGAFGPKRVITLDAGPTPPAPHKMVDNSTGC